MHGRGSGAPPRTTAGGARAAQQLMHNAATEPAAAGEKRAGEITIRVSERYSSFKHKESLGFDHV